MNRRNVLALLGTAPFAGLQIPAPSDIPHLSGIPICSCNYQMMVIPKTDNLVTCVRNYCPNFGKRFRMPVIPLEPVNA
jgi:hypothetical protein